MNPFPDSPVNVPPSPAGGPAPGRFVGANRFKLERIIGQGGMGVVWLAQDRLLREPVALKFLPPQICLDPAALQGLRREALRARKLSHPNILRIHDLIDAADEPPFLCMEFVDGPTLHALRAERTERVLSWEFLAPLVRQLCAALDYAHGEKIIHRDLKPANLMLTSDGRLKLADFGLARVISDSMSRLSEHTHTSGTPAYMSPQQADGERPQVCDDIYSLGATLYELLTSTPPFAAGDVSYQLRHRDPVPPSRRLAELDLVNPVPETVEQTILACLAKAPQDRPQSAAEVLQMLDLVRSSDISKISEPERLPVHSRATRFAAVSMGVATCAFVAWLLARQPDAESTAVATSEAARVAASDPAPVLEDGFEVLFNGRDLSGWDGDTNFWHVRDGAITAFTAEEGITRRVNTCLIWREPVEDFELQLKFRLQDVITAKPANSGVMYRARRMKDWRVQGYQCDLHGAQVGTLLLLWDTLLDPRNELGRRSVLQDVNGKTTFRPEDGQVSSRISSPFAKDDWNELVIIARGNHIIHEVNGVRTADVRDESPTARSFAGCLALELKRATTVQFQDIRLKRFAVGESAAR